MRRQLILSSILLVMGVFFVFAGGASAAPVYTFDTGLEGWTTSPNSGSGTIYWWPAAGNPDGNMVATNSIGEMYAVAPATISGDLSIYDGIQWDSQHISAVGLPVTGGSIYLFGSTNPLTVYRTIPNPISVGVWTTQYASFLSDFTLDPDFPGTDPLSVVLADVDYLAINMSTSQDPGDPFLLGLQIDNVEFKPVPIPCAVWLLSSGLIAIVCLRRRKYK